MAVEIERVVLFVGGVGGAKLAYGLKEVLPPEKLTIVVNTADDFWLYGLRICPDLDTITYTLGQRVNKQMGWGVANDTTQMLGMLGALGEDTWFRLGDIDLATHLLRTELLRNGMSLTDITDRIRTSLGVQHHILPMTDDTVATIVDTVEHGEMGFQTYFVRNRWQPVVQALHYEGANTATVTPQVQQAIEDASVIILGPSNPWLSIAPILAVGDMRERLASRDVPRIAVSPIVGGEAIKGPTAKIMAELDVPQHAKSVAGYYGDVINGFAYDNIDAPLQLDSLRTAAFQTIMKTDRDKIALAEQLLGWIESWS
ncbi:MAG: 2-phospho-L-lactate transferase [Chloroflexota bacterium]